MRCPVQGDSLKQSCITNFTEIKNTCSHMYVVDRFVPLPPLSQHLHSLLGLFTGLSVSEMSVELDVAEVVVPFKLILS